MLITPVTHTSDTSRHTHTHSHTPAYPPSPPQAINQAHTAYLITAHITLVWRTHTVHREQEHIPQDPFVGCGCAMRHRCWYYLPNLFEERGGGVGWGWSDTVRHGWKENIHVRRRRLLRHRDNSIPWYEKFTRHRITLAGVFSLNTVKYELREVTGFNVGEHVWWKHRGLAALTSFSSQDHFYLLRHGGDLTVARIPETSFLQLVQQNNCIVFFCQKLGKRGDTMAEQEAARGYSGIGLPLWEQAQLCHRQNSWCQGEVERYTGRRRRGFTASVTCSWQQTQTQVKRERLTFTG